MATVKIAMSPNLIPISTIFNYSQNLSQKKQNQK